MGSTPGKKSKSAEACFKSVGVHICSIGSTKDSHSETMVAQGDANDVGNIVLTYSTGWFTKPGCHRD